MSEKLILWEDIADCLHGEVQDWWRQTREILIMPLGDEEDVGGWKEL